MRSVFTYHQNACVLCFLSLVRVKMRDDLPASYLGLLELPQLPPHGE